MPIVFNDAVDDMLIFEQCPTFVGGQVSNAKANTLNMSQSSFLQNCFIHIRGEIRKRRGTRNLFEGTVAALNQRIQKLFRYKTPTLNKLLAFAAGKAYEFNEIPDTWTVYFDAAISDIDEPISACQLVDDLFWTDTAKNAVRRWNGATVSSVGGSPDATLLVSFTNRLIASGVASTPHQISFSDFLDGTTWGPTNKIYIGSNGDEITAIYPWQKSNLLVFKELSTHVIQCVPTLTVAQFPLDVIHNTVGCPAKRSICQVGQDVFFLSRNGVMTVQKQLATDTNVIPVALSEPVQNVILATRWDMIHKACAICYNNHYILALPILSNEPDVAIVYNYLTQSWAGVWAGITATDFYEQPFAGRTRMLMGSSAGRVREALDYLLETQEDSNSYTDGPSTPVVLIIRTRAMEFNDPVSPKTGWYLEAEFWGKDGSVEIYAILDGDNPVLLEDGAFTFSVTQVTLPTTLPFTLGEPKWIKKTFSLMDLGQFREMQLEIRGTSGNLAIRNMTLSAYTDTVEFSREVEL